MIYLDYSANTPVRPENLEVFVNATNKYMANPNSSHKIGVSARDAIFRASRNISSYFNAPPESVIYTSGSSESNNLVIKGCADQHPNGKIIISEIEHSSIVAPCNHLISQGFDVDIIHINKNGLIDLEELKNKIDDNTFLVSICAVDSELGSIQPLSEIAEIVKEYPKCYFHTDATQAIGKINIDYSDIDFITFAPHKFYGLNGFGALINRNNIKLTPLIHGGKSSTPFRSGTPVTANALALSEALDFAQNTLESQETLFYINHLKNSLKWQLESDLGQNMIHINSPENSVPSILNFSLKNNQAKEVVHLLSEKNIYVSTNTACSLDGMPSKSVFAITHDKDLALNSIRVSLSYKTTNVEIQKFVETLKKILETQCI